MTAEETKTRAESAEDAAGALKAKRQLRAERTVKLLSFFVPAIFGYVAAFTILRAGAPYEFRSEYLNQLVLAIAISIVVSAVIGAALTRLLPLTKIYDLANDFPGELESRFKSALRAGNPKTEMKRGRISMSDERKAEHVMQLLDQLNSHDRLTRGHSERVRAYSMLIGEEMRLSEEQLDQLKWAALLHDVGKLDVPARILNRVDEEPSIAEMAVLKRHPANARPYLEPLESWLGETVYEGARYHHEYWDGSGYPTGVAGEDIPLFGRIIAVADAFDVMTHSRSYQKPQAIERARKELKAHASKQFDPEVVAAFLRIGDPKLKAVRGWSATIAGLSVSAESNLVGVGSQAAVVAASVAGGLVIADVPFPPKRPPAIAFEVATTTTTTTTPAPTTTEPVSSTTIATTSTTEDPIEWLSLGYTIKTTERDGQEVPLEADTLEVFLDDEPNQTIDLEPGQESVTVVLDVTDVPAGVHLVRFDLYLDGDQVASETFPVNR